MAENTKIEWCDHTFNPWIGCTKVSPGCANCYAEKLDVRFGGGHWGKGAPRKRTSEANWRGPMLWNEKPMQIYDAPGGERGHRRARVFCGSLCDWLDDEVPIEWLADLLDLICRTPSLDWLLLTKRPEKFFDRMEKASLFVGEKLVTDRSQKELARYIQRWRTGSAPHNVWMGTTVENQPMADLRIPELLKIPVRVRFLSCEPLLSEIDFGLTRRREGAKKNQNNSWPELRAFAPSREHIDWVICGGESGPRARPMETNWARSLRDQCKAAGVPFFLKQMEIDGKLVKMPALDGVEHNEMPEVRP